MSTSNKLTDMKIQKYCAVFIMLMLVMTPYHIYVLVLVMILYHINFFPCSQECQQREQSCQASLRAAGGGAPRQSWQVCVICMCIVYVCMFVCMYVCMFVCMFICMYVCMYVCLYVCLYICMFVCLFVCVYVRMLVCMYTILTYY